MSDHIDEPDARRPELNMAVLVVDTKGFSKHDDDTQSQMQVFIVDVLQRAFERAKLERYWRDSHFQDGTGDGYIVGFTEAALPLVVEQLFDGLQEELRLAARHRDIDMRMRLALNVGPVPMYTDIRLDSPVGKTMIDTCRMADSDQTRELLNSSDPDITRLAVVVSDGVLDWTVRRNRKGWHRETEYVAHRITVADKEFQAVAHLHVPAPSGKLLAHGLIGVQESEAAEPEQPNRTEPVSSRDISGDRNRSYGDVSGEVRDESVGVGDVSGDVGALGHFSNDGDVAGRDVVRDSTVNNAGRDVNQARGDLNAGRDSGRRWWHGETGRTR